jgi:acetyl esterase
MTVPSKEPMHSFIDIVAPADAGNISIRIYRPGASSGLPVALYLHGGGWVMGSIESYDDLCRRIANQAKCLLVSVDYGLSPEHKFPHALNETYALIGWLAHNAAQFGGDGSLMAVCGDSAGGNLATCLAIMARDRGVPAIRHQLLIYPMIDPSCEYGSVSDYAEGYGLNRSTIRWFWQEYLRNPSDAVDPYAFPLHADLTGMPATTIVTAGFDPLRDEGEAYASALSAAGTQVSILRFPNMIHGFMQLTDEVDQASNAISAVSALMRSVLSAQV